ncbi:MAG: type I methionyl aminopeptidase [Syntrophorhabdales bacterium]|jgi:methionyl aminopeptidase
MIVLKNKEEIEKMRRAGKYAMEVLVALKEFVVSGARTADLEHACIEMMRKRADVKPAFKGYNGFPYALCVSVNDEVVHGMPSERVIEEGDIVSLDFGAIYKGFYGDAAITYPVGRISEDAERLVRVTRESLYKGIENVREGNRLHDVSYAIQSHVEAQGFSVVREFVGHGIGTRLHEEPQIPNFGVKGTGVRLKKGMVLAIEPMINAGGSEIIIRENGWTAATKDGKLSAHFEHTVALTEKGPEILSAL